MVKQQLRLYYISSLHVLGYKCGLLSTVENQIGDQVVPATHTTPDAISLNALLKQMVDEGCTHVFMEVKFTCDSSAPDYRFAVCRRHIQQYHA